MRIKLCCLLLVAVLLCVPLSSCAPKTECTETFFFMDTLITVTLYTDPTSAAPIFDNSRSLLRELDSLWSRTKEGSDIRRINEANEGSVTVDLRTADLIAKAQEISLLTGGVFDITVAPLVELWQNAEAGDRLPTADEMSSALAPVGGDFLSLHETAVTKGKSDVRIDLGGIGKGAAISCLLSYLEGCHIQGGLVSFGSNVAVFGAKPDGSAFRIALRNPVGDTPYAGKLLMEEGEILSVSGDYERYYTVKGEKYHHILDPQTGYPADSGLCSVAVLCADGALADALSTALFIMGEERARAFYDSAVYDFEAVFISSKGEVSVTGGLGDRFIP